MDEDKIKDYMQRIEKIKPYWVKHNSEHINEHEEWRQEAEDLGLIEIADKLAKLIDNLEQANECIRSIG